MIFSKRLIALTIVMTAAMVAGPVYAHEGSALHGLIDTMIPAGILILALVLMHRHIGNCRS